MSRIANSPVDLPSGVEANIANGLISVKGSQEHLNSLYMSRLIS